MNGCGATRYNLLGTYTYPEDFKLSRNTIRYRAIQFINNVKVDLNESQSSSISWDLIGEWGLDSDAKLDVVLEKKEDNAESKINVYKKLKILAGSIPLKHTTVESDLSELVPGKYCVKVVKVGDPATGNAVYFEIL